jgi:hypothetical protein
LVKGHALILGTVDCKFESDAKKKSFTTTPNPCCNKY